EGRPARQDLEQPLEIFRPVERYLQPALHSSAVADPHVGAERALQLLLELLLGGVALLLGTRTATRASLGALHFGFDVTYAPAFLDGAPGKVCNSPVIGGAEQRSRMARGEAPFPDENPHTRRKLHQPDRVCHRRAILP